MLDYEYAVEDDMIRVYGRENLRKWADLNNQKNEVEIADRWLWALQEGTNDINSLLDGNCPYAVPFAADAVPQLIVSLCATYAGVMLYESRGVTDIDPVTGRTIHQLQFKKNWYEKTIKQICGRTRSLGIVPTSVAVPVVVKDHAHHRHLHGVPSNLFSSIYVEGCGYEEYRRHNLYD